MHVWAGISMQGATPIFLFSGTMDAQFYIHVSILEEALLPFVRQKFSDCEHRLMQYNDCSRLARQFFMDNNINWWPTPPESPDINPIKNLWHELEEFLRAKVKPTINQNLRKELPLFGQKLV